MGSGHLQNVIQLLLHRYVLVLQLLHFVLPFCFDSAIHLLPLQLFNSLLNFYLKFIYLRFYFFI